MPGIVLSSPTLDAPGLAALGERWRALEAEADPSPFQTWTWVGCNAAERYPDPLLVEAHAGGRLAGLALWNRRRSWLRGDARWLHESGDAALDAAFTEHNAPLVARHAPEALPAALLRAALRRRDGRRPCLMLSGIGGPTRDAALQAGAALPGQDRAAPYVDFALLPPGAAYADQLSRNTRQQLRRSDRAYAERGALRIEQAETAEQALLFLGALIGLHAAAWQARGKPGAFASPAMRRFHEALVRRGVPGEVRLLRVTAGASVVGYLYNLVRGGRACAYQSGFDYPGAARHAKPGLTCHHLAIEAHRAAGGVSYDFLGGADRYKRSLANAERTLHWLGVAPPRHPAALLARLRRLVRP